MAKETYAPPKAKENGHSDKGFGHVVEQIWADFAEMRDVEERLRLWQDVQAHQAATAKQLPDGADMEKPAKLKDTFFDDVEFCHDGGMSQVPDLFDLTRSIGALVAAVSLAANIYSTTVVNLEFLATSDLFEAADSSASTVLIIRIILYHASGAYLRPGALTAICELAVVGWCLLDLVVHIGYALKHLGNRNFMFWHFVGRIFTENIAELQVVSALKLLNFVCPAVSGPVFSTLYSDLCQEKASWGRRACELGWFLLSRLVMGVIGFDVFVVKFSTAFSDRGMYKERVGFTLSCVIVNLIFLNQTLGIVQVTRYTRRRLLTFIFGGEDGIISDHERAKQQVWRASMVSTLWTSSRGRHLPLVDFLSVMLTYSDSDFQTLVLTGKIHERAQARAQKGGKRRCGTSQVGEAVAEFTAFAHKEMSIIEGDAEALGREIESEFEGLLHSLNGQHIHQEKMLHCVAFRQGNVAAHDKLMLHSSPDVTDGGDLVDIRVTGPTSPDYPFPDRYFDDLEEVGGRATRNSNTSVTTTGSAALHHPPTDAYPSGFRQRRPRSEKLPGLPVQHRDERFYTHDGRVTREEERRSQLHIGFRGGDRRDSRGSSGRSDRGSHSGSHSSGVGSGRPTLRKGWSLTQAPPPPELENTLEELFGNLPVRVPGKRLMLDRKATLALDLASNHGKRKHTDTVELLQRTASSVGSKASNNKLKAGPRRSLLERHPSDSSTGTGTWEPATPPPEPEVEVVTQRSMLDYQWSLDDQDSAWLQTSMPRETHLHEVKHKLRIHIKKAVNLRIADFSNFGGKSDPYCTCEIVGKPQGRIKTQVIKRCLEPVWNFEGELEGCREGDQLEFCVYDHDTLSSDDCIGRLVLDYRQFEQNFDGSPLLDETGGVDSFITVRVEVLHDEMCCARARRSEPAEEARRPPEVNEAVLPDISASPKRAAGRKTAITALPTGVAAALNSCLASPGSTTRRRATAPGHHVVIVEPEPSFRPSFDTASSWKPARMDEEPDAEAVSPPTSLSSTRIPTAELQRKEPEPSFRPSFDTASSWKPARMDEEPDAEAVSPPTSLSSTRIPTAELQRKATWLLEDRSDDEEQEEQDVSRGSLLSTGSLGRGSLLSQQRSPGETPRRQTRPWSSTTRAFQSVGESPELFRADSSSSTLGASLPPLPPPEDPPPDQLEREGKERRRSTKGRKSEKPEKPDSPDAEGRRKSRKSRSRTRDRLGEALPDGEGPPQPDGRLPPELAADGYE